MMRILVRYRRWGAALFITTACSGSQGARLMADGDAGELEGGAGGSGARPGSGGAPGSGGKGSGGSLGSGGSSTGGTGAGGKSAGGGTSSGGTSAGGASSGGSGGMNTGGAATGGASTGGGTGCPANPPAGLPDGALTRFSGNPILRNGPEAYDIGKAGPRVIRKEGPNDYRMWYEAVAAGPTTTDMGYATSTDGLTWTKRGTVMAPSGGWEGNEVSPQSMLFEDGVYKLWYHAGGQTQSHRNIGYATSTDGRTWTKRDQPVLTVGQGGAFDDDETAEPRVFRVGGAYRMYYTGKNESSERKSLGIATSPDGITWTKGATNPILDTNRWGNFWGGAFFQEAGLWHLWHAVESGSGQLAYKWSRDGLQWTDGTRNPVLVTATAPNGPDTVFLGDSVSGYRDGSEYRIFYTGYSANLFGTEGRYEGICMARVTATCP